MAFIDHIKKHLCRIGYHSKWIGYDKPEGQIIGWLQRKPGRCKWCGFEGKVDSKGDLYR